MSKGSERYRSSDGLMESDDPNAVASWESIGKRMASEQAAWSDVLRAMGVKLEHPDDGWVDRERGKFSLSWYARFDDRPEVGDLVAFGCPPRGEFYRSWRDVFPVRRRERDPYRRDQARRYAEQPESAADGYRLCRVTNVERRHGVLGYHQKFEYEDTGVRVPPRQPRRHWRSARPASTP